MPEGTKRFNRDRLVFFQFAGDFTNHSISQGLSRFERWTAELKSYPIESDYDHTGDQLISYEKFSQDNIFYHINGYNNSHA